MMINVRTDGYKRQIKRWSPAEELCFLDSWSQRAVQLRRSKKNSLVYMEMREDLRKHGFMVEIMDIKTKIDTCTRKFRNERAKNMPSKWMHFARVGQILECMSVATVSRYHTSATETNTYTNFNSVYIKECATLKITEDNKYCTEQFVLEPYFTSNMAIGNAPQTQEDIRLNQNRVFTTLPEDQKCLNRDFELFSQLVTKELFALDEDLRVDTRRKIFNLLCDAKMIQIERNK